MTEGTTEPLGTPAEIAASLSDAQRAILRDACLPLRQKREFPDPMSADLDALVQAGMVKASGQIVEATPFGRMIRDVMVNDE